MSTQEKNAEFQVVSPVVSPSRSLSLFLKSGRRLDKKTRKPATTRRTRYTRSPPSILDSFENANMDENAAGPKARAIELVVWPRPFIVPSEYLFGDALVTNTVMAAEKTTSELTNSLALRRDRHTKRHAQYKPEKTLKDYEGPDYWAKFLLRLGNQTHEREDCNKGKESQHRCAEYFPFAESIYQLGGEQ